MRRRTLLVALVGLAAVIAAGAIIFWPRPSRFAREDYERIRVGMSRAEVEAILGPPGDFTTAPVTIYAWGPLIQHTEWCTDTGLIDVCFNNEEGKGTSDGDRVIATKFCVVVPDEQGRVENLSWRAKRQWRRWFP